MKFIDISRTMQDAPVYPGSEPFLITAVSTIKDGEEFNISMLRGDSHLGTHIDAPFHALADGTTIEQQPLMHYYGPCRVMTVRQGLLQPEDLRNIKSCERLLLKSDGTAFLSIAAANLLAKQNLLLLGTDGLSAAPPDNEAMIHRILLQKNIALLENLDLSQAPDGAYILSAFPLKIAHGDGAPVRAVLLLP